MIQPTRDHVRISNRLDFLQPVLVNDLVEGVKQIVQEQTHQEIRMQIRRSLGKPHQIGEQNRNPVDVVHDREFSPLDSLQDGRGQDAPQHLLRLGVFLLEILGEQEDRREHDRFEPQDIHQEIQLRHDAIAMAAVVISFDRRRPQIPRQQRGADAGVNPKPPQTLLRAPKKGRAHGTEKTPQQDPAAFSDASQRHVDGERQDQNAAQLTRDEEVVPAPGATDAREEDRAHDGAVGEGHEGGDVLAEEEVHDAPDGAGEDGRGAEHEEGGSLDELFLVVGGVVVVVVVVVFVFVFVVVAGFLRSANGQPLPEGLPGGEIFFLVQQVQRRQLGQRPVHLELEQLGVFEFVRRAERRVASPGALSGAAAGLAVGGFVAVAVVVAVVVVVVIVVGGVGNAIVAAVVVIVPSFLLAILKSCGGDMAIAIAIILAFVIVTDTILDAIGCTRSSSSSSGSVSSSSIVLVGIRTVLSIVAAIPVVTDAQIIRRR